MGVMVWAIGLPLLAVVLGALLPAASLRWVGRLLMAGLAASLVTLWHGIWSAPDPLATWFYSIVASLSIAALWYSEVYTAAEAQLHAWPEGRVRSYSILLYAFIGSLLALALVANFLWLWIAMEAATLTSVFLTGTPGDTKSTEAAWKYLLVTEVGGFVALVGTILLLSLTGRSLGAWSYVPPVTHAVAADPHGVLIGALLVLVGYATKAGLAPFHTWLPDAHSEAPAPISGLLSGLKLSAALLIAYRLFHVAATAVPYGWLSESFIALGLVSLLVAASFVAFQPDLKRIWAYSSIEHIGLVSLGMGFGGIALIGAVLHIWTHGVSKTLLFHNAGTVRLLYHSSRMDAGARGLMQRTPWSGAILALGSAAIVGLPPFAPFWSEWLILAGGFQSAAHRIPTVIAIALLILTFAGIVWRMPGWLFTPGRAQGATRPSMRIREPWPLVVPSVVLAVFVIVGGVGIPWLLPSLWHHLISGLKVETL